MGKFKYIDKWKSKTGKWVYKYKEDVGNGLANAKRIGQNVGKSAKSGQQRFKKQIIKGNQRIVNNAKKVGRTATNAGSRVGEAVNSGYRRVKAFSSDPKWEANYAAYSAAKKTSQKVSKADARGSKVASLITKGAGKVQSITRRNLNDIDHQMLTRAWVQNGTSYYNKAWGAHQMRKRKRGLDFEDYGFAPRNTGFNEWYSERFGHHTRTSEPGPGYEEGRMPYRQTQNRNRDTNRANKYLERQKSQRENAHFSSGGNNSRKYKTPLRNREEAYKVVPRKYSRKRGGAR